MLRDMVYTEFTAEVASKSPAPGGGSVSAAVGAFGCALLAMVCNLTLGKKKYAEVEPQVSDVLARAEKLRMRFVELIDEDTDAFNRLFAFFKFKEMTEEQKREMAETERACIEVPQTTMKTALAALEAAADLAPIGNKNAISDLGVAVKCLETAFHGAEFNVRINLANMNAEKKAPYERWLGEMDQRCRGLVDQAMTTVREELGL